MSDNGMRVHSSKLVGAKCVFELNRKVSPHPKRHLTKRIMHYDVNA